MSPAATDIADRLIGLLRSIRDDETNTRAVRASAAQHVAYFETLTDVGLTPERAIALVAEAGDRMHAWMMATFPEDPTATAARNTLVAGLLDAWGITESRPQ